MNDRKFRFVTADGTFTLTGIDFFVEFPTNIAAPNKNVTGVNLKGLWQYLPDGNPDLGKRYISETTQRNYAAYVSRAGTLEVTWNSNAGWSADDPGYLKFERITLKRLQVLEGSNNALLKFDLEFEWLANAAVARFIEFTLDGGGTIGTNALNYVVEHSGKSRSSFVEVFRAAPVRIPNGPGLRTIRVTSVIQTLGGTTPLELRENAEYVIAGWCSVLGKSGSIAFSSASYAAELQDVKPSNMTLPDALVYELTFVTGYGS